MAPSKQLRRDNIRTSERCYVYSRSRRLRVKMEKWHNKVAVVTGASSGIGAACCKYLVENGMIVVGLARRRERVEQLRDHWKGDRDRQQRLHALKCDVRNEAEVCAVFREIEEKYGPVAVLVNNAGIMGYSPLVAEGNSEDLRAIMETNVLGVAYCTREAFRSMSKNNNSIGHVIIINSVAGHKTLFFENAFSNLYTPSKFAITAMTDTYRHEFLTHNTKIKVTSISPGVVETEMLHNSPLKGKELLPFLEPEDIADAVIYCLQTPLRVQIHELTIKPLGEKF